MFGNESDQVKVEEAAYQSGGEERVAKELPNAMNSESTTTNYTNKAIANHVNADLAFMTNELNAATRAIAEAERLQSPVFNMASGMEQGQVVHMTFEELRKIGKTHRTFSEIMREVEKNGQNMEGLYLYPPSDYRPQKSTKKMSLATSAEPDSRASRRRLTAKKKPSSLSASPRKSSPYARSKSVGSPSPLRSTTPVSKTVKSPIKPTASKRESMLNKMPGGTVKSASTPASAVKENSDPSENKASSLSGKEKSEAEEKLKSKGKKPNVLSKDELAPAFKFSNETISTYLGPDFYSIGQKPMSFNDKTSTNKASREKTPPLKRKTLNKAAEQSLASDKSNSEPGHAVAGSSKGHVSLAEAAEAVFAKTVLQVNATTPAFTSSPHDPAVNDNTLDADSQRIYYKFPDKPLFKADGTLKPFRLSQLIPYHVPGPKRPNMFIGHYTPSDEDLTLKARNKTPRNTSSVETLSLDEQRPILQLPPPAKKKKKKRSKGKRSKSSAFPVPVVNSRKSSPRPSTSEQETPTAPSPKASTSKPAASKPTPIVKTKEKSQPVPRPKPGPSMSIIKRKSLILPLPPPSPAPVPVLPPPALVKSKKDVQKALSSKPGTPAPGSATKSLPQQPQGAAQSSRPKLVSLQFIPPVKK